jgi:hypothetical protein
LWLACFVRLSVTQKRQAAWAKLDIVSIEQVFLHISTVWYLKADSSLKHAVFIDELLG